MFGKQYSLVTKPRKQLLQTCRGTKKSGRRTCVCRQSGTTSSDLSASSGGASDSKTTALASVPADKKKRSIQLRAHTGTCTHTIRYIFSLPSLPVLLCIEPVKSKHLLHLLGTMSLCSTFHCLQKNKYFPPFAFFEVDACYAYTFTFWSKFIEKK